MATPPDLATDVDVSVVIPTYNRLRLLAGAIDSVLTQQGAGRVEVIVVDDGSSDGTVEALQTAYAGQPVRMLRNAGAKGPAGGRNTGIRAARGALVALLDSDDAFLPDHLAAARRTMDRHAEVDVVFGRARYERAGESVDYMGPNFEAKLARSQQASEDDEAVVFGPGFRHDLLRDGCWFNLSSVVMRQAAARSLMDERLRISEDYEFWVRLAGRHRFACLKAPQIRYALHEENISFEASADPADHAPRLLQALDIIRGHDGMDATGRRLIDAQAAQLLFDWAWRCAGAGQTAQAARLHWQSLQHGLGAANLLALLKLPMHHLRRH